MSKNKADEAPLGEPTGAAGPLPERRWTYLEVTVDLDKKTWKDSAGRRRKLKRGETADVLAEVGQEGWELAGVLAIADDDKARLFFKRPLTDATDGPAAAKAASGDATVTPEETPDPADAPAAPVLAGRPRY